MSSSSRKSLGPKRNSSQGVHATPDKRANPTVLARKKRSLLNQKDDRVTLEKVLGLTCVNGNGLAVSSEAKCIAYPAGCVVVLYHPKQNKQSHLINPAKKHVSCIAFSLDGKHLAAGECGHQPCVRVWDVASQSVLSEVQGHSFGISCLRFSPNAKYLVSVGYHHDMMVCLWSWRNGTKMASNKVSSKVCGVDFSEDGSYFVTVGHRHVRYWYIKTQDKSWQLQPLHGRSAVLGEHLKESFVGVCCGKGGTATNTYCVTKSGKLCMFNEKRALDQFVELQVPGANCLAISEQYVFCGCSNGIVRLFDPYTLEYVTTLPKPHHLGITIAAFDPDEQRSKESHKTKTEDPTVFPDTVAIGIDVEQNRLSCVYNDRSLYVWDLRNIKHIGKLHSFLYHNACVWDVDVNPDQSGHTLPPNCFATCSSDCTIRFWCLDSNLPPQWKNVYSKELLRIVYTNKDTNYLKDSSSVPDATRGVRTLKFRPNGQHLAVGDRTGNLQLYDLQFMDTIREVEAHDSEVLCVEFSEPRLGYEFMATSSRDRLVHVFDASTDYQFLQTLDEHSSAITAVKFALGKENQFQLISCGTDKSIMFRSYENSKDSPSFQLTSHIAGKSTLYDMVTDVTGKFLATAGQDRNVRIYHIATGKKRQSYKAGGSEEGTLIKVALDPSSSFIATSSSDKSLCLFDFYSGEMIARLYGHSEVITGIKFSNDLQRIYTTSGDGCIFVWRLSVDLSQGIYDRLVELGKPPPNCPEPQESVVRRETYNIQPTVTSSSTVPPAPTTEVSRDEPDFRFSISELPRWAQKQLLTRPSVAAEVEKRERQPLPTSNTPIRVAGKWAERVADLEADGRIMFARDTEEADRKPSPPHVPNSTDSVVTADVQEILSVSDSESDSEEVEEEVVYLDKTLNKDSSSDGDAEVFIITSPIKVSSPEPSDSKEDSPEREDDSPLESPMSAPIPLLFETADTKEGEAFLKTNFESLTSANADSFFGTSHSQADISSGRLSISTKFLSKSLDTRRDLRRILNVTQPTSAPLLRSDSEEPTLVEVSASPLLSVPRPLGEDRETNQVFPESVENLKKVFSECSDGNKQPMPGNTSGDKKPSVSEEVDRARRRLQELGWSITNKEDGSNKVIAIPSTDVSARSKSSPQDQIVPSVLGSQQNYEEVIVIEDLEPGSEVTVDEPGSEVTVDEPGGEVTVDGPGNGVTVDEPGSEVTLDKPGGMVTVDEPGSEVTVDEPGSEVTVDEPGGKVTVDEPGGKVTVDEPGGKVTVDEPGNGVTVDEPGNEVTVDEPGSEVTADEPGSEVTADEPGSYTGEAGGFGGEVLKYELGVEVPGIESDTETPGNVNIDTSSLIQEIEKVQDQLASSYQALVRLRRKLISKNETRDESEGSIMQELPLGWNQAPFAGIVSHSSSASVRGTMCNTRSQENRSSLQKWNPEESQNGSEFHSRTPSDKNVFDDGAVLDILQKYSEQLVDVFRQKLHSS